MGRRKIDIERIVDPNKRMVTFSKRRTGIVNKATQLLKFCTDIVLIVFSPAGKPYTFSNSSVGVCDIVHRFIADQTKDNKKIKNSSCVQQCRKKNVVVGSDRDSFWWDNIDMEKLDSVEKLMSVRKSLAVLKQNLTARKEKLVSSSAAASSSPSSTIQDSINDTKEHCRELDPNFESQFDGKSTMLMLQDEVGGRDEEVEGGPSTDLAL
ncbi:agamous-like MADS-box protein AGL29 [Papaver somniferum]|uniref:agamous-like MADS-box protein AGL29 n=1 Tax=Papaver somniferum TaxID=3469 RepID=UPI000E6F956E|nr:agamous-like MADS-box protein AGL29 [Papaver somniferum]